MARVFQLCCLIAALAWPGCAPRFVSNDISQVIAERTAQWPVTSQSYDVYGGYGSGCSYPYARLYLAAGQTHLIKAPLSGVVNRINPCVIAGTNDKFTISMEVGYRGATPVYLEMSFEPVAGKLCSGAGQDEAYFRTSYYVNEGVKLKQGDELARLAAVGSTASLSLRLRADGSMICPEIFAASSFLGTLATSACGSDAIAAGTLCAGLTDSENPSLKLQ